jgi:hypothetical protein
LDECIDWNLSAKLTAEGNAFLSESDTANDRLKQIDEVPTSGAEKSDADNH